MSAEKNNITLTPIIDNQNNKLLIPNSTTTTNTNTSSTNNNNQFEIYIGGSTLSGALMINSSSIINNDQNDKYPVPNDNTWPYVIKFTRENIPVPLQHDEYIKFISCGYNQLVVSTNFSKCYLFGFYSEPTEQFCRLLPFKLSKNDDNSLQNQLMCKITHLQCGEQFVILKDELDRLWYAGISRFGYESGYGSLGESLNFTLLDSDDELKELLIQNNKITKVVAGGRHAVICVNDCLIFTIGNNYYNQLGYGRNIKKLVNEVDITSYSDFFVKVNWNLDKNYKVKELICAGNETGVLTSCGKFFKTALPFSDDICSLKLIEIPNRIVTIGANWSNFFVMTEKEGYYDKVYSSSGFEKDEYQNLIFDHLKDKKNNTLNGTKLVSGTNSNDFCGLFNEREVRLMDKTVWKEMIVLKTELPIVSVTSAYNVTVVFCKKELVCDMQRKLFTTKGLFDIDIKV
ncbi:hypothetical protein ABK040_013437 [Willaertia magna]